MTAATLSCGHVKQVGSQEAEGNDVGCIDCGYVWRTIVALATQPTSPDTSVDREETE